ncbi:MAG: transposase [Verrucomicrobia bacterium]|nr:transposase [Verrucomicrobiota bacterium]
MSQFILDAVGEMGTSAAKVNHRGSGSEQYPPAKLLSLLIYSYTSGVFSSRPIERATCDSVATRVLCGDTRPDHDTICAFRRENRELATKEGRARYKQRQQTIEPVFGIIKEAIGFRSFSLRGQGKVALEWTLVCVSCNLRRLHGLVNMKTQNITPAWS